MGEKDVKRGSDTEQLRVFTKRVLDDQHVPVEAEGHELVGLSHRLLLRFLASEDRERQDAPVPVSRIMHRGLVTEREFTGIAGQLLEKMLQE